MADANGPNRKSAILLVDGDVLLRTEVAAYLRECGFRVIETASMDEAVRVMDSGLRVEIAFVDPEAPSSNEGFNLARWIRKAYPHVRIVLSSSVRRTAKEAESPCEDGPLLSRSYDYQILERHLRRLLAHRALPPNGE
jgi:CheY-like chemotaxis protein